MDRPKVTKIRGWIKSGFYDDPEILDAVVDHCIEAIVREIDRSATQETHAQAIAALPTERARRPRVRPRGHKTYAVAADRQAGDRSRPAHASRDIP